MKLSKNILLITILLFSIQVNATVYEDAEDEKTNRWKVYDKTPVGATIDNVYQEDRDQNAIEFIGAGRSNGYILGNWENRDGAWNNTKEHTLQWSMNFDEGYTIYVRIMTKDGARYIYYTPSDESYGKRNNEYIHIGLGSKSNNGTWQDFSRDLASDLRKYEPNNKLVAVNAFLIRGNGFVDDVELIGESNSNILHGAKLDNSGDGSYYQWDDADAVRGLIFNAHQNFRLKSVKVYNQEGQASTRVFTLYNASGNVVASESVYVNEGEQRIVLNMQVPKGNGYKLMADIHKGLYKNNNATGYPYNIGNTVSITSSDLKNAHYYFLYDWEIEVDAFIPEPIPNPEIKTKAFIPKLDFSKNDVYGNGNIINVSTVSELSHAIKNASAKTTIVLADGVYENVSIRVPVGINNITVKAEHTHKAIIIPKGNEGSSMLYFSRAVTEKDAIHHINIIGLLIRGNDDKNRQFVKSEGGGAYDVHHIYFEKLKIHDLFMVIYSGLHSHDWTVNNCEMYNSRYSHMWYMMGWHQSVINSKFYNGSHDIIAIRGYYPEGERYYGVWKSKTTDPEGHQRQLDEQERYNPLTENRTNREGFIESSDWTHLIDNNQFLSWNMKTPQRSNWNTHLGIAYGNYDNLPYGAENVYLPPQNITITNNTFSNIGEHPNAHINAIKLDARKGINNSNPASINGITINNNTFTADKDDEKFIVSGDGNPNLDKIDLKNNIIK